MKTRARRPWIIDVGKRARAPLNRFFSRQSLVATDPILDTAAFPWLRHLEAAAPAIKREAEAILANIAAVPPMNEMSPDHRRIAGDGGWRTFFLVGYGFPLQHNIARCPETMHALRQVPNLVTALISILEPGMHVRRHTGLSRGICIAHLGLKVPRDAAACRMQVEDQTIHWAEGKTFVFDDTREHEVWNATDETRVILLIQFIRPMRMLGRAVIGLLLKAVRWSPYIQDARANVDYWERRFRVLETRGGGSAHPSSEAF